MKTILAPIDFSDCSKLVIAESVTLARAIGARLVLLHVIQPLPGGSSEFGFAEATAQVADAAIHHAVKRLTHIQRQLSDQKIRVETVHVTGVPGAVIVRRAEEVQASYIVVGSHGHSAFYELIVGSTASRVIKEATCPVVVVPSRARPTPEAFSLDLEPLDQRETAPSLASPARR